MASTTSRSVPAPGIKQILAKTVTFWASDAPLKPGAAQKGTALSSGRR